MVFCLCDYEWLSCIVKIWRCGSECKGAINNQPQSDSYFSLTFSWVALFGILMVRGLENMCVVVIGRAAKVGVRERGGGKQIKPEPQDRIPDSLSVLA